MKNPGEEESIMDDSKTSLADLRRLVENFVNERNWKEYHTPKDLTIAISIEVAELMEHFLFRPDQIMPADDEGFMEEMADIFIYLMSLANTLGIESFSQVVAEKMVKNRIKYPVEKYSGKNYTKQ